MKILITPTSLCADADIPAVRSLKEFADELVFNPLGRPLQENELIEYLSGCDGMIAGLDFITEKVMENAQPLKVISRYGVGCDRVELAAAKRKGIVVTNTPGTNSTAVAELAFGLMLALSRKIPMLDRQTKGGLWVRSMGSELGGKTLGILGLGTIGKLAARQAQGFSMRVCAFDPYLDQNYAKQNQIDSVSLEELMQCSDYISLHLPLTNETRHIIDSKRIAAMKDGVVIVNTARGGLIDEAAACTAIETGKIGGLGLDSFELEPPQPSRLFEFDNVVLTPHAGAHTKEAVEKMASAAVLNLIDVLCGRPCDFIVNK